MAGQFDVQMIREYLLGQIANGSQSELEKSLLTDDQWFEELLVVEDELIDDYLGGKLTADERERFEKHFLSTSERRQKLRFGQAFKKYVSTSEADEAKPELRHVREFRPSRPQWSWTNVFSSSPLRVAVSAIVILGLAFGIWRVFFHQSDVDKGLLALNAAYRQQRPVEARISALGYAPFSQMRGGEKERLDTSARDRAQRILLDAEHDQPGSASRHALGQFYLAEKQFDKAIALFEEALKADPRNAQILSDLGVALLEKGKLDSNSAELGRGGEEFARSLAYLNKALELDVNLLEALFNRALCYQYMKLPHQAEHDWREYLKKDSTSQWSMEARQNLSLLEERERNSSRTKEEVLRDFRSAYEAGEVDSAWRIISISRDDLSGTNIAQQLLDSYLDLAAKSKHNDAEHELQALSYVSELEIRKADEHYNQEIAKVCRSLRSQQNETMAAAHALMKSGYESYAKAKLSDAIEVFQRARQTFLELGDDPEVSLADYWSAYCFLESHGTKQALSILMPLAQHCEQHRYRWLLMRAMHSMAIGQFRLNELSRAIDYSNRALSIAEQLGDAIGAFNELDVLTEFYRSIDNYPKSIDCIMRSQQMNDCCAFNPIKVWRHYAIVASAFNSAGFYAAAVEYQKEAVQRALESGDISMICLSYAHLGLMQAKLGDFQEGLKSEQIAYETAAAHSREMQGKEMMAYSLLQTGHLYREQGDCDAAVKNYDQSIGQAANLDVPTQLYQAHKGRLFCYIAQGDDARAKEELQTALRLIEKYRSTILEADNRNQFFDTEQSVYDLAIDFAYSKLNDREAAFDYSEDSRARSLLDLLTSRSNTLNENRAPDLGFNAVATPLHFSSIRQRIPDGTQILQYVVLTNKVVAWVADNQSLKATELPVSQADLTAKVRDYLGLISRPATGEEVRTKGKELFDLLIRPIEPILDRDKQLYVMPDKILNSLPFGALTSTVSNRFLIEEYSISYAPSSTIFVLASEEARRRQSNLPEKLLSVGNPRFSQSAFPSLSELPAAAREAKEISTYYELPRLLIGTAARKKTILNEMVASDVVHLALHAIDDTATELRSLLLLAEDQKQTGLDQTEGTLQAYEIYKLRLPRTRLVVLSACQSGSGRYYGGEGTLSLARPFIVLGVPTVVASLWAVDSEATAELMINFHRGRRREHLSSAEALRQAQLSLLSGPQERFHDPYFWAPFFALGGHATF